jgi:hypothetical protein
MHPTARTLDPTSHHQRVTSTACRPRGHRPCINLIVRPTPSSCRAAPGVSSLVRKRRPGQVEVEFPVQRVVDLDFPILLPVPRPVVDG